MLNVCLSFVGLHMVVKICMVGVIGMFQYDFSPFQKAYLIFTSNILYHRQVPTFHSDLNPLDW